MYTLPLALFVSMWSLAFADPIHVRQGELTPPTPTSSSDSPSPSPSIGFFFAQINEMTTCTPATISWLYGGPDIPVTLVITNQGVPQFDPPSSSSSSSSQDTDTQTTSSSLFSLLTDGAVTPRAVPTGLNPIDASTNETTSFTASALQMNYTWQNVTLPQGWYQAISVVAGSIINTSQLFFIQNGSDTSCLSALSPSSSASSTDSASATSTSPPTSSPSPSTGSALPATQLGSSKVSKGAIAGGVIGGLAILAAALGAFIFLRCTRASSRRAHSSGSGGGSRGWGGLASVDSTHRGAGHANKNATPKSYTDIGLISEDPFNPRAERHQSQADSLGPVVSSQTNLGGITPAVGSDDEVNSYGFAPSEEKFGSPGDDTIAPLPMYHPQQQHQHQQPPHPNPHPTALQTRRSSSGSGSGSSPPRFQSEYTPSPTASSPRRESNEYAYPPSPTSPDMHRTPSSGGGGGGSTRRTTRKPVPAYNPSDVTLDAPHSVAHSWSTGAPVGASASDLGHGHAHVEYDPFGEVGMSGKGRGGLPIPIPELNHKSSFGDTKPVHYLIPDMPPSMR